jgi:uncharacterized protein
LTEAVVDTNVLIFDVFEDSEFHRDASKGLDSLEKWNLPSMVFHELVWFLRGREIDYSRASVIVEEYLTHEKTIYQQSPADDIRFAINRLKHFKNYNDYIILVAAKRLDLPLFTFDRELKKLASSLGIRTI